MIKIYSIKEIIEASNTIFDRSKKKKLLKSNKSTNINKQEIFRNESPLLLKDEVVFKKKNNSTKENKIKINNKEDGVLYYPNNTSDQINILYKKLDKKIKKNTLKLIFDLEKDLNFFKDKTRSLSESNNNLIDQKKILKDEIYIISKNLNDKLQNLTKQNLILINEKKIFKEKFKQSLKSLKNSKEELSLLNENKIQLEKKIQKLISQNQFKDKKIYDINKIKDKNEFYKEENLRISNELHETRKKLDIMKQEVNKFQAQKTNMIKKINSINNEIKDSNIMTNVFAKTISPEKIDIIDHNIDKKNKLDLDQEILKIFKITK